jgi:short-subunit dehydrogenase
MDPKGKVVWITGASSGIGRALALEMARCGARLILSSRRERELRAVADECGQLGVEARVLPLDLDDLAGMQARADAAWNLHRRVDMLVNNAGIGQRSTAAETEVSVDAAIMRTNYMGTVALTKALLPRMVNRNLGQIVVTTSVLGKYGVQRRSAYAASKHALHGFFDSLRCELRAAGSRITVTLVCPGWVRTDISRNALEGDGSRHGRLSPGQESGMPPELFAKKMLRAIRRDAEEAAIGGREAWAVLAKRFVPGYLNRKLPTIDID